MMGLKSFIQSLGSKVKAEGSAFAKIVEVDVQAIEAKGRIIAIDAANKVKNELADLVEKEVDRVHTDLAAVKTRFSNVLAKL